MSDTAKPMIDNPFGAITRIQPAPGALANAEQHRAVAEVQARMIIARSNPRNPVQAMDHIINDCARPSLAAGALYAYARGGTDITGPTIRLAETIARRWGNIASGIKEIGRTKGYSECVAYAWDLETGYYDERQYQVRHWRDTRSGGKEVTDERDIYELVANMGQRRKRAVILTVVPGDVVEAAIEACEATLHATADLSPEALKRLADAFSATYGVTQQQIEARIQRRLEAIRPAQVVQLRKIYASLKDGMSEPRDWFEIPTYTPDPISNSPLMQPASDAAAQQQQSAETAADQKEGDPPPQHGTPPRKTRTAFLDELENKMRECDSLQEVNLLVAHPDTKRAVETFTDGPHKARLGAIIASGLAAHAPVTHEGDDDREWEAGETTGGLRFE